MRKAISLLLVLALCVGFCLSLSACGKNQAKEDYVGIWQWNDGPWSANYMYIYEDGTGDEYGAHGSTAHFNSFTWELEDGYLVTTFSSGITGTTVTKYTLDGDRLINRQGIVAYTKHSNDTSVDIELN